jgi:hypothetical protein
MRTLGIDLASAKERTGAAVLEWDAARGQLVVIPTDVVDKGRHRNLSVQ